MPATHQNQPRQPIKEPTAAASGTPSSRANDCPLITQPSARPRWRSSTCAATSANSTPMKEPARDAADRGERGDLAESRRTGLQSPS